ncbi:MAG: 30S ribosomal protein S2 [Candidatus Hydrogenedentota bacterium]
MASITMRDLLEAGIHFGHQTRRWNPKMARFIFGERHGIYIVDLQKTMRQLQKAYTAVRDAAAAGGQVLFVGTKKQAKEAVEREAQRCGEYFVTQRWLGGTLTNWQTIQKSIAKLHRLEDLEASGRIEQYGKKERIGLRKDREKLEKNLSGIKKMDGVPAVMFVIDTVREDIAVAEAKRLNIPCIGIVDTNADPDAVSIPVPGNDDAIRAISLFCRLMADATIDGKTQYEKNRFEEEAQQRATIKEQAARTGKLTKQRQKFAEDSPEADEAPSEAAGPVEAVAAAVAGDED